MKLSHPPGVVVLEVLSRQPVLSPNLIAQATVAKRLEVIYPRRISLRSTYQKTLKRVVFGWVGVPMH
jgi:hypothetical protein